MSKVITFSRTFPLYHPRKGDPTYFVEQSWNGLNILKLPVPKNEDVPSDFLWSILPLSNYGEKYHTIRKGYRWKVGDKFSPRVWSGKPYQSKQIIIAPDIEIKKIWDVEIFIESDRIHIAHKLTHNTLELFPFNQVAKNDGLTFKDMKDWFNVKPDKPFIGQIICWNENIEY